MKAKICFCAALLSLTIVGNAQTIYIPNGTSGIGNNTNSGNVLIGKSNNTNNLKLTIPGVYNFEQVNLGQFGNGASGLEFINHTSVNPSYGVRLFANVDQKPGLQIQTANSTYSYNDLAYNTRMFISLDGNVGVGTTSPATNFEIAGTTNGSSNNSWINFDVTATSNPKIFSKGWNASLDLYTYTIQGSPNLGQLHLNTNGNVGIGTTTPSGKLSIFYPYNVAPTLSSSAYAPFILNNAGTEITMGVDSNAPFSSWLQAKNSNLPWNLTINPLGGNVGIGTTNPQNKLDVNGTIRAKEVKVETGWADFVFTPTYKLRPLTEVEQFIKTNGHLPEIPKAEEVQQKGVSLGEMQTKLLQKVEELTLYLIEQERGKTELKATLEEQSKENKELKLKLANYEKEMKELKKLLIEKLK